MKNRLVVSAVAMALLFALPGWAEEPDEAEGMSLEEISKMLDNPLGNLWIIFMQNDFARYQGKPARKGGKNINTFMFQPVLPISLTENWNLVTRPIIPIVTAPKFQVPSRDFGDCPGNCNSDGPPSFRLGSSRKTELADIMAWTMISPAEPMELPDGGKLVWGLGPAFRFPSATEDQFGSEKFSIGPSAIAMRLPPKDGSWTLGLFHQSHFSVAGESDRDRVRTSQFQYIYWYKLPIEQEVSVGAFPMVDVNWDAKSGDKLRFPIGIGASTTFFVGPMPIRAGFEFDYYAVQADSYGPRYLLRFFLVPVLPRPGFAGKPIFGG